MSNGRPSRHGSRAANIAYVDQEIFLFEQRGVDPQGRVLGHFSATGVRPRFADRLKLFGVPVPDDVGSRDVIGVPSLSVNLIVSASVRET